MKSNAAWPEKKHNADTKSVTQNTHLTTLMTWRTAPSLVFVLLKRKKEKRHSCGSTRQVVLRETMCGASPCNYRTKRNWSVAGEWKKKRLTLVPAAGKGSSSQRQNFGDSACIGAVALQCEGRGRLPLARLYVFRNRFAGCGSTEVVLPSSGGVHWLLMFTPRHGWNEWAIVSISPSISPSFFPSVASSVTGSKAAGEG